MEFILSVVLLLLLPLFCLTGACLLVWYNKGCRTLLINTILIAVDKMTQKQKGDLAKAFVEIYKQYPSGRFLEMLDEYEANRKPQKDTDKKTNKVNVSMHVPRKK